jgi:outer membrane protein assembly factor BamA
MAKGYRFELGFAMPRLADGRLQLDLDAGHHNYPRMEYYGPGPDSEKGSRSVYRLEETSFDASLAIVPTGYLRMGVTGGYVAVNVGPGVRTGVVSTDQVFVPAVTPGIQDQTNFYRTGGFLEFDYRDIPGGPRSGGYYTARFLYHDDQDLRLYSFRRLDLEAQQYVPFFNKKRVIALRARTGMTWAGAAQTVPFYMQPYVGGADTLRGFRNFRFSDDNHIVTNIEYRWESFPGLDMALFFDAGKVTNKRTQLNFHEL